jgi:hypothetical protein
MSRRSRSSVPQKGLPGGVLAPTIALVLCAALFVVAWRDSELIDLGPRLNPAGIGVIGAAISLFWLLVAMGKRPPPP